MLRYVCLLVSIWFASSVKSEFSSGNYGKTFYRHYGPRLSSLAATTNTRMFALLATKTALSNVISLETGVTVFVPTDEAFERLSPRQRDLLLKGESYYLTNILKYHVVRGVYRIRSWQNEATMTSLTGQPVRQNVYEVRNHFKYSRNPFQRLLTANGARVVQFDQPFSHGFVHTVDTVMMPPYGNIVEALFTKDARLMFFLTALKHCGTKQRSLTSTLMHDGPFTVFAPSDSAFRQIGLGTFYQLLYRPRLLDEMMSYHVVKGTYFSAGLSTNRKKSLHGENLAVVSSKDRDGGWRINVNDATIVMPDLSALNGVVHVIDKVLMPAKIGRMQPLAAQRYGYRFHTSGKHYYG